METEGNPDGLLETDDGVLRCTFSGCLLEMDEKFMSFGSPEEEASEGTFEGVADGVSEFTLDGLVMACSTQMGH